MRGICHIGLEKLPLGRVLNNRGTWLSIKIGLEKLPFGRVFINRGTWLSIEPGDMVHLCLV